MKKHIIVKTNTNRKENNMSDTLVVKNMNSLINSTFGNSVVDEDPEKKILRQKELFTKLKASDTQYELLLQKYSVKKINKLKKSLDNFKYGYHASAPVVCLGPEKCPFYHACPVGDGYKADGLGGKIPVYDSVSDFPIGDQCILEKVYIEQKLIDYLTEFDVDPGSASELSLINDLALLDLYKQRCVLFLAAGDKQSEGLDFLKVDLMFDENGNETSRSYKEHPVMGIIERLEKRRHKILEELLATRKGKLTILAKIKKSEDSSKLLDELEKIRNVISTEKTTIIDVAEEYIELE